MSFPVGHPAHACIGCPHDVVSSKPGGEAGLRRVLEDIKLLALEANEEYEASCRSKVSRIYMLAKEALA